MKCPQCHNKDINYMAIKNNQLYCRKCLSFIPTSGEVVEKENYSGFVDYHLDYQLTRPQQEMSNFLLSRYKKHLDSRIKAVCGAGKTEMIYAVIKYALNHHQRVCLTMPRKELVIELSQRIKNQFRDLDCCEVYGGHHQQLDSQLVICTTHQLYHYPQCFDLLILDEEDAFPYRNNEILEFFLKKSIRGHYIFMSATSLSYDKNLLQRYHGGKLPVPFYHRLTHRLQIIYLIIMAIQNKREKKPTLIFAPCIKDTTTIVRILNYFKIRSVATTSHSQNNKENIARFKEGQLDVLVATTLLERGVTFSNVQVIVYHCDHIVFSRDTLIQIAGRVGRKIPYIDGKVVFLCYRPTSAMKECISTITKDNASSVINS